MSKADSDFASSALIALCVIAFFDVPAWAFEVIGVSHFDLFVNLPSPGKLPQGEVHVQTECSFGRQGHLTLGALAVLKTRNAQLFGN